MAGWIETRLRGHAYFEDRRQRAVDLLCAALAKRGDGWNFGTETLGPFTFDAAHKTIPLCLLVVSDGWRSYRQRHELFAWQSYAGQSGFHFKAILADAILRDLDGVIAELGIDVPADR